MSQFVRSWIGDLFGAPSCGKVEPTYGVEQIAFGKANGELGDAGFDVFLTEQVDGVAYQPAGRKRCNDCRGRDEDTLGVGHFYNGCDVVIGSSPGVFNLEDELGTLIGINGVIVVAIGEAQVINLEIIEFLRNGGLSRCLRASTIVTVGGAVVVTAFFASRCSDGYSGARTL